MEQPQGAESQESYTRRCVADLVRDGRIEGQEAVAICQAQWREKTRCHTR